MQVLSFRRVYVWDSDRAFQSPQFCLDSHCCRSGRCRGSSGWNDPPTVRGILRRGTIVESIGRTLASRRFTAFNMGAQQQDHRSVWRRATIHHNRCSDTYGPTSYESRLRPMHKKNLALGEMAVRFSPSVFLEQIDAVSFADGKDSRKVSSSAIVAAILMRLKLDGDSKLTGKPLAGASDAGLSATTTVSTKK
ncbi:hypothetical protein FA95DRAFT_1308085 [Auriscalpium vulgare]|uniref:Uncharacterized protein n=1 Tax=Auriscalpium vulgare TaxID=40419 RepID=A0ACB8RRI4_9AGAM|nr:hypothetical protein FA95DRAFT_1308085 [Auriscalpium vulgare]